MDRFRVALEHGPDARNVSAVLWTINGKMWRAATMKACE